MRELLLKNIGSLGSFLMRFTLGCKVTGREWALGLVSLKLYLVLLDPDSGYPRGEARLWGVFGVSIVVCSAESNNDKETCARHFLSKDLNLAPKFRDSRLKNDAEIRENREN